MHQGSACMHFTGSCSVPAPSCLRASGSHAAFKDKTIRFPFLSLMTIFTPSITMCNFYAITRPLFIHCYIFKRVGVNILCHGLKKKGCFTALKAVWGKFLLLK